jgi:hypothetical protein
VALSLAIVALMLPWHASTVKESDTQFGQWQLERVIDTFAHAQTCRLVHAHVVVTTAAARLELGKSVDTADALYRIDGGPLLAARLDIPRLVAAGVKVQDDSVPNPSGGAVIVPISRLKDASRVDVRPNAKSPIYNFTLRGLASALQRANDRGCGFPSWD